MSRYNFEGDLQGASQRQLDFIGEVLEKRGYKGSKVVIEPVGKAGENYMADVKRIVVQENGETFKMVAKLAPDNKNREAMSFDMFQNEHFMYTTVFPKFDEKQKSAGIPENERFRFAKCYGTLMESSNEVILLEDLKESNFNITNRFEPLKNECVKLVLKNFAIYHALSYIVRYQEPETYAVFQKKLTPNINDAREEKAQKFFSHMEAHAIQVADGRCTRVLKGAVSSSPKNEAKIRKFAKDSKHSVIQMGDAWSSNIMFRFEDEVPVECVLVDYQMVKENSPVFDVMYMIFNTTNHQQRQQHFYEYIDFYHNELDKALNSFGLKANFVYPRDRLDADMKIYGKLLFATCIVVSSIITKKTEEAETTKEALKAIDMASSNAGDLLKVLMAQGLDSAELFKVRVEGLSDSFREFGLV